MKISSSLAATLFALLALTTLVQCVAQSPSAPSAPATSLSPAQLDRVGKRIWQNECAGTIDGLTSWNSGEDFASLGIGHFIWYPAGRRGPFEESFPRLIAYLGQRGINAPAWMQGPCLWNDRASFLADKSSPRQQELRRLLSSTVREQTEFIRIRSRAALPKMLAAAGPNANRVRYHFDLLSATPEGTFALIDYVNFKGEGTAPAERYQGRGWGLLQVLENMTARTPADAPAAFADSASRVLTQRVQLSPPDRGESRWLPGWKNRCQNYKQPL
jgi:hypothetical protein